MTEMTLAVVVPVSHRALAPGEQAVECRCPGGQCRSRVDAIIDPASRKDRTLWLFFFNPDGTQANVVMPIDDIPAYPGPDEAEGLFEMLAHLLDPDGPGGSLVVTITRSGTTDLTESDRRWAAILGRGAAEAGTPLRMLCLATPEGVRGLGQDSAMTID